jgi:type II secretory pathway component PulM
LVSSVILFLDDDPGRIRWLRSQAPSATCCETAQEMIAAFSDAQGSIEWLFLDHDLGGEIHVDSNEPNTGMEVVRWLETHRKEVGTVVVHLLKTTAAQAMIERLACAGYHAVHVPFIQLRLEGL